MLKFFVFAALIAAVSASCYGYCGGYSSSGGCYCDSVCQSYGDCCGDYVPACIGGGCSGYCGGYSSTGGCYCDSACVGYGDCCSDYQSVCVAAGCSGYCGGYSDTGGCYCDSACSSYGDCCADYTTVCAQPVNCAGYWGGCDTWSCQKTYSISTYESNGGAGCSYYNGQTAQCDNTGECSWNCEGYWAGCEGWSCTHSWVMTTNAQGQGSCSYYNGQTTGCSTSECNYNCEGYWAGCSAGNCLQTYVYTQNQQNAGSACSYSNGATKTCDDTNQCDIGCIGAWGGCNTAVNVCTQTYSISQAKNLNGAACSYSNGATKTCDNPSTCDVNCVGDWGGCNTAVNVCTQTYSISTNQQASGSHCSYSNGATKTCVASNTCDINCVGAWNSCDPSSCKQTFYISTYQQASGSHCSASNGAQKTCDNYSLCDVDCSGGWGSCDPPSCIQTYSISTYQQASGSHCAYSNGAQKTCDNYGLCDVDCVGSWSSCNTAVGVCTQTYSISTNQQAGGSYCSYSHGQTKTCDDKSTCAVNCVGSWYGPCNDHGCLETYTVSVPQQAYGASCPAADQETRTCVDESLCDEHCVGAWGACNTAVNVCTQTYDVTVPDANDGYPCEAADNEVRTCIDSSICNVNCVGSWGACDPAVGTCLETYSVSVNQQAGGSQCANYNGETRTCVNSVNVCDVDCVGAWSACNPLVGACEQTFEITVPAVANGIQCSFNHGDTKPCDDLSVCDVDCVGSYGACDPVVGSCQETYSVTTPVANGGIACEAADGATRTCVDALLLCDVNCEGGWSGPCNDHGCLESFSISVATKNGGTTCEAAAGQTRTCVDESQCDEHCVGSWGVCDGTLGYCLETYAVTVPVANDGVDCEAATGDERTCLDTSVCSFDCVGDWGACNPPTCTQGFLVDQAQQGTGSSCPNAAGDIQYCADDSVCDFDCVGEWSDCNPAVGVCQQTYIITSPKANAGAECPFNNGDTKTCDDSANVCDVDCVGGWGGPCDDHGCLETFVVSTSVKNGGITCDAANGATRTCVDESLCDEHCTGAWNTCNTAVNVCTETYEVFVPSANDGVDCEADNGDTRTCLDPTVCDVDCVGAWSSCDPSVGVCLQTYVVSTPQQAGGASCAATDGETRPCTNSATVCDVDCVGTWGGCNPAVGACLETYAVTTPVKNGGVACEATDLATRTCTDVSVCDQDCVGGWGVCDNTICDQTYDISVPVLNGGVQCNSVDGATRPCTDDEFCDVDCVGDWDACDPVSCTETYSMFVYQANNGAQCPAANNDVRTCVDQTLCNVNCVGTWGMCDTSAGVCEETYAISTPQNAGGAQCVSSNGATRTCPDSSICDVDCVAAWGACNPAVGACIETYNVDTAPENNGVTCANIDGDTRQCQNYALCDVDCVGDWLSCNPMTCTQEYWIYTFAANAGLQCSNAVGDSQTCTDLTQCNQDCMGQWDGPCDDHSCIETYSISQVQQVGGQHCAAYDGETRECADSSQCDEHCVGSWSSCSPSLCLETYSITLPAANDGYECEQNDGTSRTCLDTSTCDYDCWGSWSDCDVDTCEQTFSITQVAQNAGTPCSNDNGDVRQCPNPTVCNVDCDGAWSPCSASACIQIYSITTSQQASGAACTANDGDIQTCEDLTQCDQDCVGSWTGDCDDDICIETYVVTQPQQVNGAFCSEFDATTRTCVDDSQCDDHCVGSWSVCNVNTCEQTYSITEFPANDGTQCEANNGERKTCVDTSQCNFDCEGEWGFCDADSCLETFTVTQFPQKAGSPCSATDGDTRECGDLNQCNIDCVGSWSECDNSVGMCKEVFSISQDAYGAGIVCGAVDGQSKVCGDTSLCVVDCQGKWSDCDTTTCTVEYSVSQDAANGGALCEAGPGATELCADQTVCDVDCTGDYGICDNQTCQQTYTVFISKANNGANCPIADGGTKLCDDTTSCDFDCVGEWSDCDAPTCKEYYVISTPHANNGDVCDEADGSVRDCVNTSGCILDCAGLWSACDANTCTETFEVSQAAQNGGVPCADSHGDTKDCVDATLCDADCVGAWDPCDNSVCIQTYRTTTAQNGNGVACPFADGETKTCDNDSQCEDHCVGQWSDCDNNACTQTFSVITPADNGGDNCEASDGDTRTCLVTDNCAVDCVAAWGSCDSALCEEVYTIFTEPANGGAECAAGVLDGTERPCDDPTECDQDCVGDWGSCDWQTCLEPFIHSAKQQANGSPCFFAEGATQYCTDDSQCLSVTESCNNNCGGAAASGCMCDLACEEFGDCCADYEGRCDPGYGYTQLSNEYADICRSSAGSDYCRCMDQWGPSYKMKVFSEQACKEMAQQQNKRYAFTVNNNGVIKCVVADECSNFKVKASGKVYEAPKTEFACDVDLMCDNCKCAGALKYEGTGTYEPFAMTLHECAFAAKVAGMSKFSFHNENQKCWIPTSVEQCVFPQLRVNDEDDGVWSTYSHSCDGPQAIDCQGGYDGCDAGSCKQTYSHWVEAANGGLECPLADGEEIACADVNQCTFDPASCKNLCEGVSLDGSCKCDRSCEYYGDCCVDWVDECDPSRKDGCDYMEYSTYMCRNGEYCAGNPSTGKYYEADGITTEEACRDLAIAMRKVYWSFRIQPANPGCRLHDELNTMAPQSADWIMGGGYCVNRNAVVMKLNDVDYQACCSTYTARQSFLEACTAANGPATCSTVVPYAETRRNLHKEPIRRRLQSGSIAMVMFTGDTSGINAIASGESEETLNDIVVDGAVYSASTSYTAVPEEDTSFCVDMDSYNAPVIVDKFEDGCEWYNAGQNSQYCGYYNTEDFDANTLCCGCGGGGNVNDEIYLAPECEDETGCAWNEYCNAEQQCANEDLCCQYEDSYTGACPSICYNLIPGFCFDSNSDLDTGDVFLDSDGNACDFYTESMNGGNDICGIYDDDDFDAITMCCACANSAGPTVPAFPEGCTDLAEICDYYLTDPFSCGDNDTDEFDASNDCCMCGGGEYSWMSTTQAPVGQSCAGKCGNGSEYVGSNGMTCYCDKYCNYYDDCCSDFYDECPSTTLCYDDFVDSTGADCQDYLDYNWCDADGYGSAWLDLWGTFEDYMNADGLTPYACPQCGCAQDCDGYWSSCNVDLCIEQYTVNFPAVGGTECEATNGDYRKCMDDSMCADVDCTSFDDEEDCADALVCAWESRDGDDACYDLDNCSELGKDACKDSSVCDWTTLTDDPEESKACYSTFENCSDYEEKGDCNTHPFCAWDEDAKICMDKENPTTTTVAPTTEPPAFDYTDCGIKGYEVTSCLGATNSAAENAATLKDCQDMAEEAMVQQFAYNADKGKCFGVTPETKAACQVTEEDLSEKWIYYEFWCSEGYTEEELCTGDKIVKKFGCDCNEYEVQGMGSIDACEAKTEALGMQYFAYNKKKDKCEVCEDSLDGGYTECIENQVSDNKYKIYELICEDVEFISPDYYCDAAVEGQLAIAQAGFKCDKTSASNSIVATKAECNNFAYDEGYDWFAYHDDDELCYFGNKSSDNRGCRNVNNKNANNWDIYAVCDAVGELMSDEELKCHGYDNCVGGDCLVPWSESAESWKCDGVDQSFKNQAFGVCVDHAVNENAMWMNFRTSNGACGVIDNCYPTETGSEWQIFINCALVNDGRRN